jgi:hypothetical protein
VRIDDFMPLYDIRVRHSKLVDAPGAAILPAFRQSDLGRSWLIRTLFALRGIPKSALRLDGMLSFGFVPLLDTPDQEVLIGLIGKFWMPSGGLAKVAPQDFVSFQRRGYAKAVLAVAVNFLEPGRCEVVTETRVKAYGKDAKLKFRLYWTLIAPFSGLIRREMLRLIRVQAGDVPEASLPNRSL